MYQKRFVAVALMILVALTFAAVAFAEEKAPEKKPRITLVEPVKDFGTVPKGTKIDWSFQIKNTGDADLEIKSANPSCGCTVADFDKLIKPGQTGKVNAHVDTTNFAGPISKSVTVQSTDPETPAAQLTITANVKPYVDAFPAGFVRYTMLQGEEQTQSVTLYSEDEEPFKILSVEAPGDWVKVKYAKIENVADRAKAGRAGQNQYKFDITVNSKSAPVGPLTDKVLIKTNSKYQPEFRLSLSGVIRPSYIVAPSVLNLGEVTAASLETSPRIVTVQTNNRANPEAFKVTKVESNIPEIIAEAKSTDQPGVYEVSVKLSKTAKAGKTFEGKLQIMTTDAMKPMVEVAVQGSVK